MTGSPYRPQPHLRLVSDWGRANKLHGPPGWTSQDVRFLRSVARYPLPLNAAQHRLLAWVLERAS